MSLMLSDVAASRSRTVPPMASDIATGVAWRTELPQGMGELRPTSPSTLVERAGSDGSVVVWERVTLAHIKSALIRISSGRTSPRYD